MPRRILVACKRLLLSSARVSCGGRPSIGTIVSSQTRRLRDGNQHYHNGSPSWCRHDSVNNDEVHSSTALTKGRIVIQYPSHSNPYDTASDNGQSDTLPGTRNVSNSAILYETASSSNQFVQRRCDSRRVSPKQTSWHDLVALWQQGSFFLTPFLPAGYPHTVQQPGYTHYAAASSVAAVAGSASSVLATQCILTGVLGGAAPVAAGALNWILKDGLGQLGGVLFASHYTSRSRQQSYDAQPKEWRLIAGLALDAASLLEMAAVPMVVACMGSQHGSSTAVVLLAATACVLKNIGFLTASASKAALHQALATSQNLADITAKAGSQSMVAGLVGTALGISLAATTSLLHTTDPALLQGDMEAATFSFSYQYLCTFGGLMLVHQVGTLISVRAVVFRHLNAPRLDLVLTEYLDTGRVLSPSEVAAKEFPRWPQYFQSESKKQETGKQILIGSPLKAFCPRGPEELSHLLHLYRGQRYLLNRLETDSNTQVCVHLVYLEGATGEDLIRGLLHARLALVPQVYDVAHKEHHTSTNASDECKRLFPELLGALQKLGWQTSTDMTCVEPHGALRLALPNG